MSDVSRMDCFRVGFGGGLGGAERAASRILVEGLMPQVRQEGVAETPGVWFEGRGLEKLQIGQIQVTEVMAGEAVRVGVPGRLLVPFGWAELPGPVLVQAVERLLAFKWSVILGEDLRKPAWGKLLVRAIIGEDVWDIGT